jgi:hypothetical protein
MGTMVIMTAIIMADITATTTAAVITRIITGATVIIISGGTYGASNIYSIYL